MTARNRVLRDLRAAGPRFTGADRWALDIATCRRPAAEHTRLLAWAHLKSRRGQALRQTVVQRQARERDADRAAARAHHPQPQEAPHGI